MDRFPTLPSAAVRSLDRLAIEEYGIESIVLMENAARACVEEARRLLRFGTVRQAMNRLRQPGSKDDVPRNMEELSLWQESLNRTDDPTVVLCGPGNNGGDGLAIARTLHNNGYEVCVYYVAPIARLDDCGKDVVQNARLLRGLGVEIRELSTPAQIAEAEKTLKQAPLIVDALFGTGLNRSLEDPVLAVVAQANDSPAPKLAVDIPTGLDADTGNVHTLCIRAEITVTFVVAKPGMYEKAGPTFVGQIVVAEIGIPRNLIQEALRNDSGRMKAEG